jgi:Fic family protein
MDPDGLDQQGFFTKLVNLHNLRVAAHRIVTGAIESGSRFVMSAEAVKLLHRICMAGLLDEAGEYRQCPVTLTNSPYVPPHHSEVELHMKQFCTYVNDEWDKKGPTFLSAFCLWRLNWIHPFRNGNGRMSREISYVVLNIKCKQVLPSRKGTIVEQIAGSAATRVAYEAALRNGDSIYTATANIEAAVQPMERLITQLLTEQLKANL